MIYFLLRQMRLHSFEKSKYVKINCLQVIVNDSCAQQYLVKLSSIKITRLERIHICFCNLRFLLHCRCTTHYIHMSALILLIVNEIKIVPCTYTMQITANVLRLLPLGVIKTAQLYVQNSCCSCNRRTQIHVSNST